MTQFAKYQTCVYCLRNYESNSIKRTIEHILPAFLKNNRNYPTELKLSKGLVCNECNNNFSKFESIFKKRYAFLLAKFPSLHRDSTRENIRYIRTDITKGAYCEGSHLYINQTENNDVKIDFNNNQLVIKLPNTPKDEFNKQTKHIYQFLLKTLLNFVCYEYEHKKYYNAVNPYNPIFNNLKKVILEGKIDYCNYKEIQLKNYKAINIINKIIEKDSKLKCFNIMPIGYKTNYTEGIEINYQLDRYSNIFIISLRYYDTIFYTEFAPIIFYHKKVLNSYDLNNSIIKNYTYNKNFK